MHDKFGDNQFVKTLAAIPMKLASSVKDKVWDILPGRAQGCRQGGWDRR